MDKSRLIQLSEKPYSATPEEIVEIKELSKSYSYSAFLKILIARIDNSRSAKNKNEKITTAAIYTSNRANLKNLLANDTKNQPSSPSQKKKKKDILKEGKKRGSVHPSTQKDEKKVTPAKKKHTPDSNKEIKDIQKEAPLVPVQGDDIKQSPEVIKTEDIKKESINISPKPEKIIKEKKADEIPSTDGQKKEDSTEINKDSLPEFNAKDSSDSDSEKEIITEQDSKPLVEEQINDDSNSAFKNSDRGPIQKQPDPDETTRTAKDNLIQEVLNNINVLKKNKETLLNLLSTDKNKKTKPSKKKPDPSGESAVIPDKEAKTSQKEKKRMEDGVNEDVIQKTYEEEDPKVIKGFLDKLEETNPPPKRKLKKKEQVELIERFISSDHRIKNIKPSEEIHKKEDLSLHSIKFRDDIISENLANIMIKQGKLDKAIDIYKKLIWKFPQKKTYFATQIEELKKKSGN